MRIVIALAVGGEMELDRILELIAKRARSGLALLLLTDAHGIRRGWGTEAATTLRSVTAGELGLAPPAGSMGPKAEAADRRAHRSSSG